MIGAMALATSQSIRDPEPGLSDEFERLANRPLSETEHAVLVQVGAGHSLWTEGLRPESLALLAISLSQAKNKRVLFVSADADLLLQRQHRFGARAATQLLPEQGPLRLAPGSGTFFCSALGLLNPQLVTSFASQPPDLIFVEHAHAVTPLSFEYRPSLELLSKVRATLGNPTFVASAAHSSPEVRDEARARWGLTDGRLLAEPLYGLSLQVLPESAHRSTAELVAPLPRPALILCATPAQADAVYAELIAEQLPCHRYHAGLSARERATELLQFALPGRRAILVATSSFGPSSGLAGENDGRFPEDFGRGYARGDLRSLVHVGMPSSLEQYGQELGLLKAQNADAGPGYAVAIFGKEHSFVTSALLDRKRPCPDTLSSVIVQLKGLARGSWLSERTLVETLGGSERAVRLVLRFLKDAGAVETATEGSQVAVRGLSLGALKKVEKELGRAFGLLREHDQLRSARLTEFAEATGCRLAAFQLALGQEPQGVCGRCDFCDPTMRVEGGSRLSRERAPQRRPNAEHFGTSADSREGPLDFDDEETAYALDA